MTDHIDPDLELLGMIAREQRELLRLQEQARDSERRAREDREAVKASRKRLDSLLQETIADRPLLAPRPTEPVPVAAAPTSWTTAEVHTLELEDTTIRELHAQGLRTVTELLRAAVNNLPGCDFDQAVDVNTALRRFRFQLDQEQGREFDALRDQFVSEFQPAVIPDAPSGAPGSPETSPDPFALPKCPDCGGDADKPNRRRKPNTRVACHIGLDGKARPMSVTPESVREKREHPPEIQPIDPDDEGDELQDEWTPEVHALHADPAVNKHGVYTQSEEISIPGIPKSAKCSASVLVAQGNDGRWRASYRYQTPKGGGGGMPSVNGKSFGSRDAAVRSICEYLAGRFAEERIAKARDAVAGFIATLEPDAPAPLVEDWPSISVHDLELSNALSNAHEQLGHRTAGDLADWLEQITRDDDDGSTVSDSLNWVYRKSAVDSVREAVEGIRQPDVPIDERDDDDDSEPCNQWDAWDGDKLLGQVDGWAESQAFTRAAGAWPKVHPNNLRVTRRAARTGLDDPEPVTDWRSVPVADLGLPTATADALLGFSVADAGRLADWLTNVESLSDQAVEYHFGIRPADRVTITSDVRNVLTELRPDDDPQPPAPTKPAKKKARRTPSDLVGEVNRG